MIETRFIDDEFQIVRNSEGFSVLTHTKPLEIKERDLRDEKIEKAAKILNAFIKNHIELIMNTFYDKKIICDFMSNMYHLDAVRKMALHAFRVAENCDIYAFDDDIVVLESQMHNLYDVFSAYHKMIDSGRYERKHDFAELFEHHCDDFYKKINKMMYANNNFHKGVFNILTGAVNDGDFDPLKTY